MRKIGKQILMAMARLKHTAFVLMLGTSILIPLFLAHSLYVDMSETVLHSCDMNFEGPDIEDSSTSQSEFKVFLPTVPSKSLSPWTRFSRLNLFSSPLMWDTQAKPVLRC